MNIIGLRKEEKAFESRVALVPDHVKSFVHGQDIPIVLEPSNQRAFSEDEYLKAGAEVLPLKGSKANVILGIKEMPIDFFELGKVYIFFSHTIKGQKYNMPLLQKMLDVGATLIDYERVVDETGRRLIFFGNWAGMAGMSDTLRSLGYLLKKQGVTPNPFEGMKPTLECRGLSELKDEFRELGKRIKTEGLPASMQPFVVGFAGYGNVSRGAQEMFDILPHEVVEPKDLASLEAKPATLYKCVFKEVHMFEPKDSSQAFDLQDYFSSGATKYKSVFQNYVPHLTVLMNCIYWTKKSPRLITKDFIREHWHDHNQKLKIIGDISCDIEGAIEFTLKCTKADDPAFTYNIQEDCAEEGVSTSGPVIMAVDNLPCELPRESSTSFSETLLGFIPALAAADFTVPFDKLSLPRAIADAIVVYQGKLTPNYEYLNQYLS
jgi:saccharopine dehydrogenase (NAD+, L-lysine-forming)